MSFFLKFKEGIVGALFTVDKNKCKGDEICAAECPLGIIRMDEREHVPVPTEEAQDACINCGHCVSVCPHGALSLAAMPVGDCRELRSGWRVAPECLEEFLKGRRSIRAYKKEPVSRECLERLVDVARYAPSGINRQPAEWIIIYEPEKVKDIAREVINWMKNLIGSDSPLAESLHMRSHISAWEKGKDYICRGAPHLIIACALKEDMIASTACTIALTYVELAAVSWGLGACWAGYVNMALNMWPPAHQLLGISKRRACFGALMVGYSQFEYYRIPVRNKVRLAGK
ncbi:MAG: nitroreductase family protein [Candidatus Omnitrophota bacterium]